MHGWGAVVQLTCSGGARRALCALTGRASPGLEACSPPAPSPRSVGSSSQGRELAQLVRPGRWGRTCLGAEWGGRTEPEGAVPGSDVGALPAHHPGRALRDERPVFRLMACWPDCVRVARGILPRAFAWRAGGGSRLGSVAPGPLGEGALPPGLQPCCRGAAANDIPRRYFTRPAFPAILRTT